MDLDELELDRFCFDLAGSMSRVFRETYGNWYGRVVSPLDPKKFDNAANRVEELAIRSMILLSGLALAVFTGAYVVIGAALLAGGSTLLQAAGIYFQKDRFTHIRGVQKNGEKTPEKIVDKDQLKVMTWNIKGYGGGLHYKEGVVHWKSRFDGIQKAILKQDPDVIVLQEVHDTALIEKIVSSLGDRYAHFYTHLGAQVFGKGTGTVVITKCNVSSFSYKDFYEKDTKAVRGFESFEIKAHPDDLEPALRIIGTQLSPGKEHLEMRKTQVAQIVNQLFQETTKLPTLFVGSLNIPRDQKEGEYLAKYLFHSYLDRDPTHSPKLASQWAPIYEGEEESVDFISFFKHASKEDGRIFPVVDRGLRLWGSHLVRAYDEDYNTKSALSDHHAVVTLFSGFQASMTLQKNAG